MENRTAVSGFAGVSTDLARYGAAGVVGTVVHYVILAVLLWSTSLGVVFASTCGAVTGAVVNYLLNYFYTFSSARDHAEAFPKFWLVAAIGWAINAGVLALGVNLLRAPIIPSQLGATGIAFLVTFFVNRRWTF